LAPINVGNYNGSLQSAGVALSRGSDRLDVIVLDNGYYVWHKRWNGQRWSPWALVTRLQGSASFEAIAVSDTSLALFYPDRDPRANPWRVLQVDYSDSQQWLAPYEAFSVKGDHLDQFSYIPDVSACSWGPTRIDLFAQYPIDGGSSLIFHAWSENGSTMSSDQPYGFFDAVTAPGVVAMAPGHLAFSLLGKDNGTRVLRTIEWF
jgi:hypothetical protein